MKKTAAIIIVGNEVLTAKVQDRNSPYLIACLHEVGLRVRAIVTIPDEREVIAEWVGRFSRECDYLFTTGGIGPTHDDVTLSAVADGLGKRVVRHEAMEKEIRRHYGGNATEEALLMADLPEGTQVTSLGREKTPLLRVDNVFMLPGFPELLPSQLDAAKVHLEGTPTYTTKIFVGEPEVVIARTLRAVQEESQDVEIGSYPALRGAEFRVMITVDAPSSERRDEVRDRLVVRLGEECVLSVEDE